MICQEFVSQTAIRETGLKTNETKRNDGENSLLFWLYLHSTSSVQSVEKKYTSTNKHTHTLKIKLTCCRRRW